MRPTRLELEGFTAFRQRTVVDFDGVDLFALWGPTGAGKSSVIDAITFALYGAVPRLGEKLIAPVLSQGLVEAKVRLDFTVDDVPYVAVRVVRATKGGGATTKEARLERGDGEVVAGDARSMTAAVVDLLGLEFRQFTTCVSLPQGDFARFLHDEPRNRQDLLVRLLDLGLYDRVATEARQRAAIATNASTLDATRLEALAGATPDAVSAAQERVENLVALRAALDAAQAELDALSSAANVAEKAAVEAETALALVGGVVVPDGVDELAAGLAEATAAYEQARVRDREAAEAAEKADAALAALPARSWVTDAQRDHDQLVQLTERIATGEAMVAGAIEADEEAATALERATVAHDQARTAELAHTLAAELTVGEPCPVCHQTVTEVHRAAPAKVAAAAKALAAARDAAGAAAKQRARLEEQLQNLRTQREETAVRLVDRPPVEELVGLLAEIDDAGDRCRRAKDTSTVAARERDVTERALEMARAAERDARVAFDGTRDRVAALGPPPATRTDLGADWRALAEWAGEQAPALAERAQQQRELAATSRAAHEAKLESLVAACAAVGVEAGARPRDAVADAVAHAEATHRQLVADALEAEALRASVAAKLEEAAVAKSLAEHLKADRFEQWLLDAVLTELVEGATTLLLELSGGAYSLTVDSKSRAFAIVDHVNADAVRLARTLSGGETFLASLALALALADEVAMVAAGGAARLETILLDEGFGTLDPETLDVVAGALEELGARGRMVGVVSHVRELAERLPVRYEIRKVAGASTVERVEG